MNLPNKPKVLAATYNPVSNTKMISFLVDFPTVLLAELRTHRILTQGSLYEHMGLDDFNMSANSARAIPTNKYLQKILDNPFIPIWTKKQTGMSGKLLTDKDYKELADALWLSRLSGYKNLDSTGEDGEVLHTDYGSIETVKDLIKIGVHKQNANRLLAPFAYTTCIISGTEWSNFFELRCPKYKMVHNGKIYFSKKAAIKDNPTGKNIETGEDRSDVTLWDNEDWLDGDMCSNISSAQPEFQIISELLYDLYQEAEWEENKYHIPFKEDICKLYGSSIIYHPDLIKKYNKDVALSFEEYYDVIMKISASMCAKLSYNTQDNEDSLEKHLERANMLIEHKHYEPFSHQAVAMDKFEFDNFTRTRLVNNNKDVVIEKGICYNLKGFRSLRYTIENG